MPLPQMLDSLTGLSTGDAFGQRMFHPGVIARCIATGQPPPAPWRWTDGTLMALGLVTHLRAHGAVAPDGLARQFAADYETALWVTAGGMGDVDTTCAIVGGVVAARVGRAGVPADWIATREPLPDGFEN